MKRLPEYIKYIAVTAFGFVFFGFLQGHSGFIDPDSFYHTKITEMMLSHGIVRHFYWLQFTVLNDIYIDHHFLYHIFLLPFIKLIPPLIGIKVATVFINTWFILLFYAFLKSQRIPATFLFVLLLLSGAPFIFRIDLVKASGFSLIFVILLLFAIYKASPYSFSKGRGRWGMYILTGAISFFYVWAYGGWPISIFLAGVYFVASLISNSILVTHVANSPLYRRIVVFLKRSEWKPLLATTLGSLMGLIINPYFPHNINFYWIQTVQIALVNYKSKIGVGAEWYGFSAAELMAYSGGILLFGLFGMLLFFGRLAKKKYLKPDYVMIRDIFFFFISAGLFFVITLKARRNTEYAFPFMVLSVAVFIKYFWDSTIYQWIKNSILRVLRFRFFYKIFIGYLIFMFVMAFGINFWKVKVGSADNFAFDKYSEAMQIAKGASEEDDIIFHSDWDDWLMLFYHNDYNRYIVGLGTTFMYKYNKDLYQKWRDITWGDFSGDPYNIIKNNFKAKIIFIAEGDIDNMDKYFVNNEKYKLLYEGEGKVYKIINNY
ncbi:MAG: hypothetical protein COU51_00045 [Parcubacteria group bacterium CG10_big_fil_rev_8_21_14_0_10_36_14]|nr:MAG: hypothetical protein COU51_00045 [Parcubacteria group bacterium CG10_big_fil_rev_8_21_14_0_10_36_14]